MGFEDDAINLYNSVEKYDKRLIKHLRKTLKNSLKFLNNFSELKDFKAELIVEDFNIRLRYKKEFGDEFNDNNLLKLLNEKMFLYMTYGIITPIYLFYWDRVKFVTKKKINFYKLSSFMFNHELMHKVQYKFKSTTFMEGFADYGSYILSNLDKKSFRIIKEWREREAKGENKLSSSDILQELNNSFKQGYSDEIINYLGMMYSYSKRSAWSYHYETLMVKELIKELNGKLYDESSFQLLIDLMKRSDKQLRIDMKRVRKKVGV